MWHRRGHARTREEGCLLIKLWAPLPQCFSALIWHWVTTSFVINRITDREAGSLAVIIYLDLVTDPVHHIRLSVFRHFCLIMFMTPHRNYKLPGQPHPRVSANKDHRPSAVPDAWEGGQTERPVEQSAKTTDLPETSQALSHHLHHPNQGFESPSLQSGMDRINLAAHSGVAAGEVLPQFLSKRRNKASGAPFSPISARKRPTSTLSPTKSFKDTTCQPKSHIFFLKTHKTASSTILNILYRYGESRNLTFALPLNKHSQLFYPHFFASHFVEGVSSRSVKEFHIMCNHMRFRKSEVSSGRRGQTYNK